MPEEDLPGFLEASLASTPKLREILSRRSGPGVEKIRARLTRLARSTERHLHALEGGPYRELVHRARERRSFAIHGDFKHNNIAFDPDDRIVKLWDLHRSRADHPLVDLCDGLLNFSRGDLDSALRFLHGYEALRPLYDDERTLLAVLVHLRFLYHVHYFLAGLFLEEESGPRAALTLMRTFGAEENARRTERLISFALWLDRHRFGDRLLAGRGGPKPAGVEGL